MTLLNKDIRVTGNYAKSIQFYFSTLKSSTFSLHDYLIMYKIYKYLYMINRSSITFMMESADKPFNHLNPVSPAQVLLS